MEGSFGIFADLSKSALATFCLALSKLKSANRGKHIARLPFISIRSFELDKRFPDVVGRRIFRVAMCQPRPDRRGLPTAKGVALFIWFPGAARETPSQRLVRSGPAAAPATRRHVGRRGRAPATWWAWPRPSDVDVRGGAPPEARQGSVGGAAVQTLAPEMAMQSTRDQKNPQPLLKSLENTVDLPHHTHCNFLR